MSRVTPDLPAIVLSSGEKAEVLQTLIDQEIKGFLAWGEVPGALSPATVELCRETVARRVAALEAARALFAGFRDLERAEALSRMATRGQA